MFGLVVVSVALAVVVGLPLVGKTQAVLLMFFFATAFVLTVISSFFLFSSVMEAFVSSSGLLFGLPWPMCCGLEQYSSMLMLLV